MIPGITAGRRKPSSGIAWNPADKGSAVTLADSNAWAYKTSATLTTYYVARAAAAKSSGKWYFEAQVTGNGFAGIGLASPTMPLEYASVALAGHNYCFFFANGQVWYNGGSYAGAAGSGYSSGVIGVAFDADAGTIRLYRNGVYLNFQQSLGTGKTYMPAVSLRDYSGDGIPMGYRLKATPQYAPPAGYQSWTP